MHHYQFHIGDYQSDTRHLELLEDLAYRRMLDLYYKSESPLPLDVKEIARLIGMRSHCDCIEIVLHDFFERTESGWKNNKADEVLKEIYDKSEKARRSAEARWAKDKAKKPQQKQQVNADAMRTDSERNANGMLPITHNPLPIINNNPPISPQGEFDTPEKKPDKRKRKTQLPDDFGLTEHRTNLATAFWSAKGRVDLDPTEQFTEFVTHHRAKGSTMADWDAAWKTWYTNAVKFNRPPVALNGAQVAKNSNRKTIAQMAREDIFNDYPR